MNTTFRFKIQPERHGVIYPTEYRDSLAAAVKTAERLMNERWARTNRDGSWDGPSTISVYVSEDPKSEGWIAIRRFSRTEGWRFLSNPQVERKLNGLEAAVTRATERLGDWLALVSPASPVPVASDAIEAAAQAADEAERIARAATTTQAERESALARARAL